MGLLVICLALILKIALIENRMIKTNDVIVPTSNTEEPEGTDDQNSEQQPHDKVIGLNKSNEDGDQEEENFEIDKKISDEIKKQCAIVVLSNVQNQSIRSLLRKYRYNADGTLIPSSVKYFIKLPQNSKAEPVLIPLNDKAFSPMGGFVRYYKEVPPIPRTW
ncbi:uncharacterized protein LOC132902648 [Amyelois transitella]|uniref:uncharacterized protein LOC132902648 n=1 Tax=Amyelois transitella TaxID=680683 RepID=UPI002990307F|nr:uncharacterized protein LOC132902648 [Amyelois transitella]